VSLDTPTPPSDPRGEEVSRRLQDLGARLDIVEAFERRSDELRAQLRTVLEALSLIHDQDAASRARLQGLRIAAGYEAAFIEPDPLVSVVIPTWNSPETLVERAIASALRQTHQKIEVIVVGDASPPATAAAVAAIDDPRVAFHNLTIRGPYDEDPARSWLASGTPGFNAGVALARGLWIAPLGDDDAFVDQHIERLLARARRDRLEFVYGRIRQILPDGSESLLGEFPPRMAQIGLQAALYHVGLRFMELELGHALFDKPNDWGLVHRMMRIGVRMGMVDEVTVNYWASGRGSPSRHTKSGPNVTVTELAAARALVTEAQARALDLEHRLSEERSRAAALEADVRELDRRLGDVVNSRSWHLTAPFRRARRKLGAR
jgi:hypothetical protein